MSHLQATDEGFAADVLSAQLKMLQNVAAIKMVKTVDGVAMPRFLMVKMHECAMPCFQMPGIRVSGNGGMQIL